MKLSTIVINGLTLLNAAMGIAAMIVLVMGPKMGWSGPFTLYVAAALITWGYVPDILDGVAARAWKETSEIGAQLDVNADTTTFNLATALLVAAVPIYSMDVNPLKAPGRLTLGVVCAMVYACAGLVRSARLVVAESPEAPVGRYFYGFTTNGASLLTTALVMVAYSLPYPDVTPWLYFAVPVLALLLAPLMVSRIAYPDVLQQLLKGVLPRWPLVLLFASIPFVGVVVAWSGMLFLYGFLLPLAFAALRRPLR